MNIILIKESFPNLQIFRKIVYSLKTIVLFCFKKNFMAPLYDWGRSASMILSHYEETIYFLPLSHQEFLILIWSTWQGCKDESTLNSPSGFELIILTELIPIFKKWYFWEVHKCNFILLRCKYWVTHLFGLKKNKVK